MIIKEIMNSKRNFQSAVLYTTALLGQLSIGIITLGLVYYMRDRFSLSSQLIGLFASVQTFSYFLGCTFLKKYISLLKPRHAVEIASAGMTISGLGIVFVGNPAAAFALYICYGAFLSFFWPPLMGWLSRGMEGRALSKAISLFNISWSAGLIIAPFISGVLTERDIRYPLYAGSLLFAAVFLLISAATLFVPGIRAASSSRKHMEVHAEEDSSTPLRFSAWAGIFSSYFLYGITVNIFPLYAREMLGYAESSVGLILLGRGLLTTVTFILLGRWTWWHFKLSQIRIQQILLVMVALLGMFASTLPVLMLFFVLFGILFGGIYTNSIFHGAAGSPDRESRMAVHEAVLTSGTIAGSFSGGLLYDHLGFTAVMGTAAVVAAAVLIFQLKGQG
jgi:DHA1 family multidrug resistance protein-like MFS transporter/DHA1 family quinolone resistance protein-like MFS transporter